MISDHFHFWYIDRHPKNEKTETLAEKMKFSIDPIQDWPFWGCSRMVGAKSPVPSLKLVTHILQWRKLKQLHLTSRRSKNLLITWHTPWVLLISAFFHRKSASFTISRNTGIDWYIKSDSFKFFWVLKYCFNGNGCNFDDVSKNGYSRSS